jgi:small ligand-binding sensory domain FIST
MVHELEGTRALDRLVELVEDGIPAAEIGLVRRGLHLRAGGGAALPVLGVDTSTGALSVRGSVRTGDAVRFHVRDPAAAHVDLRRRLAGLRADAALMFASDQRGQALFGREHHDSGVAADSLGTGALAGTSTAFEIAGSDACCALHSSSVVAAVFEDRSNPGPHSTPPPVG